MHSYFVCEEGPMGGISIVFVANDRASCDRFINQNPSRTLYIYGNVEEFED